MSKVFYLVQKSEDLSAYIKQCMQPAMPIDDRVGEAFCKVGELYRSGKITQSHEEAVKWYRKGAELGFSDAQYQLGCMYRYGQGVEQSIEEAAKWFQKAADQGNADAYFQFGQMSVIPGE